MNDQERFGQRLAAAGAEVPDELVGLVSGVGGPLVLAIDHLLALDLGDTEPFLPARRLPDDAAA
jgi:hypothetical protein